MRFTPSEAQSSPISHLARRDETVLQFFVSNHLFQVFPAQFNIYAVEYSLEYPGSTVEELAAFYAENVCFLQYLSSIIGKKAVLR